jgi:hypothetical protein
MGSRSASQKRADDAYKKHKANTKRDQMKRDEKNAADRAARDASIERLTKRER